jgi:hypothetical protein
MFDPNQPQFGFNGNQGQSGPNGQFFGGQNLPQGQGFYGPPQPFDYAAGQGNIQTPFGAPQNFIQQPPGFGMGFPPQNNFQPQFGFPHQTGMINPPPQNMMPDPYRMHQQMMQEHEARMNQHQAQINSLIQNEGGFSPDRPGSPIHMSGFCEANLNPHLNMINNPFQIRPECIPTDFEANRGLEHEGRGRAPSGYQTHGEHSENWQAFVNTRRDQYPLAGGSDSPMRGADGYFGQMYSGNSYFSPNLIYQHDTRIYYQDGYNTINDHAESEQQWDTVDENHYNYDRTSSRI